MSQTSQSVETRVETERAKLLQVLEGLDEQQWSLPSLCAGWSVRDLAVHLLMPYEVSVPRFLAMMLRAGFDFNRAADRWATS
ncbi:maleylpyruvate isomerase family mycothiol-dependent enzyme, partial [Arthrobacter deserti]|nr:maleylpyruvate isomerase family mycothiol-dependent enzyme [Arthrobacter deserti]